MNEQALNAKFNKLLNKLFNEDSWEIRAEAARNLGLLRDGRAINLLVRRLKTEENYVVINRIIEAMGRIGDARATMSIIDYLKVELDKEEPDKKRLFFIIESLLKLGDKRALTHLGILHDSCEEDIKSLTEEALNCIDINWRENIMKYDDKEKTIEMK